MRGSELPGKPSIAVLQEYFVDGLVEDIITGCRASSPLSSSLATAHLRIKARPSTSNRSEESCAFAMCLEEARRAMARALVLSPNLKISNIGSASALRRPEDRARVIEGYRLAGMPAQETESSE